MGKSARKVGAKKLATAAAKSATVPVRKPAIAGSASSVPVATTGVCSAAKPEGKASSGRKLPKTISKKKGLLKKDVFMSRKPNAKKVAASEPPPAATEDAPLKYEDKLRANGFTVVCGTDEAGRGPLAGPVVAAAFAALATKDPEVLKMMVAANDSKSMPAAQREEIFTEITDPKYAGRVAWAIAEASVSEIDKGNILKASLNAMSRAVQKLEPRPDYVLVDGCNRPPDLLKPGECWTRGTQCIVPHRAKQGWLPRGVEAVIGGDGRISSIGAASILAKVHRDALMADLDKKFPLYGFGSHKGYGTKAHVAALKKHGACAAHRKSFAPVANVLAKGSQSHVSAKARAKVDEKPTPACRRSMCKRPAARVAIQKAKMHPWSKSKSKRSKK